MRCPRFVTEGDVAAPVTGHELLLPSDGRHDQLKVEETFSPPGGTQSSRHPLHRSFSRGPPCVRKVRVAPGAGPACRRVYQQRHCPIQPIVVPQCLLCKHHQPPQAPIQTQSKQTDATSAFSKPAGRLQDAASEPEEDPQGYT